MSFANVREQCERGRGSDILSAMKWRFPSKFQTAQIGTKSPANDAKWSVDYSVKIWRDSRCTGDDTSFVTYRTHILLPLLCDLCTVITMRWKRIQDFLWLEYTHRRCQRLYMQPMLNLSRRSYILLNIAASPTNKVLQRSVYWILYGS